MIRRRLVLPLCCGYGLLFVLTLKFLLYVPEVFEFDVEIPSKHFFNCSNVHEIKLSHELDYGYSKQSYLGYYRGEKVVVKGTSPATHDVTSCLKNLKNQYAKLGTVEPYEKMVWRCSILPQMKLLKEILFMEQLQHANIIPLLGYCVKNEQPGTLHTPLQRHGAVAVYKYGQPISSRLLNWLPVYRRLVAAIELADLMHYLQTSPLGSLLFADFKSSHFLFLDGHIMLIDFDDVNDLEPACSAPDGIVNSGNNQTSTTTAKPSDEKCRYDIPCKNNLCTGVNALHNLKRTASTFIGPLISSIRFQSKQFGDSFQLDYKSVTSYLNKIDKAMAKDQSEPPTALGLKQRMVKLQEGLLYAYSGRTTTTLAPTPTS